MMTHIQMLEYKSLYRFGHFYGADILLLSSLARPLLTYGVTPEIIRSVSCSVKWLQIEAVPHREDNDMVMVNRVSWPRKLFPGNKPGACGS